MRTPFAMLVLVIGVLLLMTSVYLERCAAPTIASPVAPVAPAKKQAILLPFDAEHAPFNHAVKAGAPASDKGIFGWITMTHRDSGGRISFDFDPERPRCQDGSYFLVGGAYFPDLEDASSSYRIAPDARITMMENADDGSMRVSVVTPYEFEERLALMDAQNRPKRFWIVPRRDGMVGTIEEMQMP